MSSAAFDELTPQQVKELVEYLRFEQQKRREIRGEVSGEMGDLISAKLEMDKVYSGTEGLELLSDLPKAIGNTLNIELARQRDITTSLIARIFIEAQKNGITLELNVPALANEEATDAANMLAGKILMDGDKKAANVQQHNAPASPAPGQPKLDIEQLRAENEALKAKLAKKPREWSEFTEAQARLKELNNEAHELRTKLGEE